CSLHSAFPLSPAYSLSSSFLRVAPLHLLLFFFFNDPATTEIYTLSLHDALPIYLIRVAAARARASSSCSAERRRGRWRAKLVSRSEEHTSELQSLTNLVCRLLLEKKKKIQRIRTHHNKTVQPN